MRCRAWDDHFERRNATRRIVPGDKKRIPMGPRRIVSLEGLTRISIARSHLALLW